MFKGYEDDLIKNSFPVHKGKKISHVTVRNFLCYYDLGTLLRLFFNSHGIQVNFTVSILTTLSNDSVYWFSSYA